MQTIKVIGYRIFFNWIVYTKAWQWFASRIIARLTFRFWDYPKVPISSYFDIRTLLRKSPGPFFGFACSDAKSFCWWLNNTMAGTHFSHAGIIYHGDDGELWTLQMRDDGLHTIHLLDAMKEMDRLVIVDFNIPKVNQTNALERLMKFKTLRPTYSFNLELPQEGRHSYYCSTLALAMIKGLVPEDQIQYRTDSVPILGRAFFEPDHIPQSGNVIWSFDQ